MRLLAKDRVEEEIVVAVFVNDVGRREWFFQSRVHSVFGNFVLDLRVQIPVTISDDSIILAFRFESNGGYSGRIFDLILCGRDGGNR